VKILHSEYHIKKFGNSKFVGYIHTSGHNEIVHIVTSHLTQILVQSLLLLTSIYFNWPFIATSEIATHYTGSVCACALRTRSQSNSWYLYVTFSISRQAVYSRVKINGGSALNPPPPGSKGPSANAGQKAGVEFRLLYTLWIQFNNQLAHTIKKQHMFTECGCCSCNMVTVSSFSYHVGLYQCTVYVIYIVGFVCRRPIIWIRHIAPAITTLANLSLQTGKFPARFKSAQVLPLLKKAGLDRSLPVNYRPIS